MGCSWGTTYSKDEDQEHCVVDDVAEKTGSYGEHKFYSIINLTDSSVAKSGEMSENRQGYGLVKIQDMYYAVLGHQNGHFATSIDTFDDNSGKW